MITVPGENQGTSAIEGEEGFVLITVMFVMVLLLVLALAVSDSVVLEAKIAANHQEYNENFYPADGAAMEGAQVIATESDCVTLDPVLNPMGWIDDGPARVDPAPGADDAQVQNVIARLDNPAEWDAVPNLNLHHSRQSSLSDNLRGRVVRQMALRMNNLTGGELANSVKVQSNRGDCYNRIYQVYGLSQTNGGSTTVNIAIGYLKEE